MYSQRDEERVILEFFSTRKPRRPGGPCWFLDVGAYDGITFSTTRALAERGWSGICIEPAPWGFAKLVENYRGNPNVHLVNAPLAGTRRMMEFWICPDALSSSNMEHVRTWRDHINPKCRTHFDRAYFYSITMADITAVFLPPYDFVSIDVEGEQWNLVRCLDLAGLGAQLVCIEFGDTLPQIHEYLGRQGFVEIHRTAENTLMARG